MSMNCVLLDTAWVPNSVRLHFFYFMTAFFAEGSLFLTPFTSMW